MNYNILAIPDIHWGVIDPVQQNEYLEFILITIEECYKKEIPIDLIVILGDYWDCRLPMNSNESIIGIAWFARLYETAKKYNVKAFRMVKGTKEHDNDELEVFRHYEKPDDNWFRIFNFTTSEDTLPDMRCLYCPDETMCTEDFTNEYNDRILNNNDIGFFHGSFDVVYGEIASKPQSANNVIFEYDLFNNILPGGMYAGHWHDGKKYNNLQYIGSPFGTKFNEDEPKGIGFIRYNTETKKSWFKKILNPISPNYLTFNLYTNVANDMSAYHKLIDIVDSEFAERDKNPYQKTYIRILVYVNDDKRQNEEYITSLRRYYSKNNRVKITVKDKLKEKKQKEKVLQNQKLEEEFGFISDKSLEEAQVIQQFIAKKHGIEVPLESIANRIKKYDKQIKERKEMIPDGI